MQHGTSTSTSSRTAWYIFRANNLRLFLEKSAHWPSGPRCLNTIKGLCDGLPHCPCWLTGLVDSDLPCFRIGASVDRCRANAHSGHGSSSRGLEARGVQGASAPLDAWTRLLLGPRCVVRKLEATACVAAPYRSDSD